MAIALGILARGVLKDGRALGKSVNPSSDDRFDIVPLELGLGVSRTEVERMFGERMRAGDALDRRVGPVPESLPFGVVASPNLRD
jgi:hypothetical protein